MKKRKFVTMTIVVSVPAEMSAMDARREVRTLVNHQSNFRFDEGDVRVRRIEPGRK